MKIYRLMRIKEFVGFLVLLEFVSRSWVWGRNGREKGVGLEERK